MYSAAIVYAVQNQVDRIIKQSLRYILWMAILSIMRLTSTNYQHWSRMQETKHFSDYWTSLVHLDH